MFSIQVKFYKKGVIMDVLVAEKAREDVNFLTHINTILIRKSFKRLGTNDLFVAIFYLIKKKKAFDII